MPTVLVVDDEFSIVESLAEILSAEGYDVRTAPHGKAALAELEKGGVDLLLADFMMPLMDGYQLVQAVRARPELRDLPIVMMSAVPRHLLPQPELLNDYLGKPFDLDALLLTVQRLVGPGR